jgi:hypothetical protein
LRIVTRFPDELGPGNLAWFIKCDIEGKARGAYPAFLTKWKLPPLYQAGVRWQLEPNHGDGWEDFALPPDVYRKKWGDCDDLVIWRLCELWRAQGIHPRDVARMIGTEQCATCRTIWEGNELHVLVRLPGPGDRTEDPTEILGG